MTNVVTPDPCRGGDGKLHHYFGDYEGKSRVGKPCSCGAVIIAIEDNEGHILQTAAQQKEQDHA